VPAFPQCVVLHVLDGPGHYAKDSLQLRGDKCLLMHQLINKAAGRGLLLRVRMNQLMNKPASQGLFPGVQMLRTLHPPCPWSTDMCDAASRGSHLEVVQWLRRPGNPEGQCDFGIIFYFHMKFTEHRRFLPAQVRRNCLFV
jgi:hypothetical protein